MDIWHNTLSVFLSFLICLFNFYIANLFFRNFLTAKKDMARGHLLCTVLPACGQTAVNVLNVALQGGSPFLNMISSFFLICLVAFLFYQGKSISKFLYSILFAFLGGVTEAMVTFVTKMAFHDNFSKLSGSAMGRFILSLLCQLLLLIFIQGIIYLYKNKRYTQETRTTILLYLLPAMSMITIILNGILVLNNDSMRLQILVMIASIGLVCANLATFYVHDRLLERFELEQKVKVLEEKEKMQQIYYANIEKQQEGLRLMAHDFKNQLATIQHMQKANRNTEIYIQKLSTKLDKSREDDVGNPTLGAILYDKRQECDRLCLTLETRILYGDLEFMDPTDICAVFANLLDNAITACQKVPNPEKRFIRLLIKRQKDMLYITVENSKGERIRTNGTRFLSTKKEPGVHGLGIESVKRAVARYDGTFHTHYDKETFQVIVVLPIDSKDVNNM